MKVYAVRWCLRLYEGGSPGDIWDIEEEKLFKERLDADNFRDEIVAAGLLLGIDDMVNRTCVFEQVVS